MKKNNNSFPELPYEEWKDTLDTLHMWMQIIGKVKLELCPFINHWWHITYTLTSTGMTTGKIPYKDEVFEIDLCFVKHVLRITTSSGKSEIIQLRPISVSEFYNEFMYALKNLGIEVSINVIPVEFAETIPFPEDTKHCSYNKDYVERWWKIQLKLSLMLEKFRGTFSGKSSPVHFFWGSFDLSLTLFSGNTCEPPKMEGVMGKIMGLAENEENFAVGFWPGEGRYEHPALYSYMYPAPKGIENVNLNSGYFDKNLGEFILPYLEVINSKDPEKVIMNFVETTYNESAKLAGWDVNSFVCKS